MIVIRSDSSFQIGSGHVMRDLALAERLSKYDRNICFVCRNFPGHFADQIVKSGYQLKLLPETAETKAEIEVIKALQPDWLVVDHYDIQKEWEIQFDGICRVLVIDDLANRPHHCDVLIDQNFHSKKDPYAGLQEKSSNRYVGPQFSLLRSHILELDQKEKVNPYVLCFFGGSDYSGETLKFVKALQKRPTQLKLKIVVTRNNVKFSELSQIPPEGFELHLAPANWEELLAGATLYFGSGGSVTWERMYLGVPGCVVSVAENQYEIARSLAEHSYQKFLGHAEEVDYADALSFLEKLFADKVELERLVSRGKHLVRPFPEAILKMYFSSEPSQELHLVPANITHADFLFGLRNDPLTVAMFRSRSTVSKEEHVAWLKRKLDDYDSRIYIAYSGDTPVGQFRVDGDGGTSLSVHASHRGRGLAKKIVELGSEIYFLEKPGVSELYAEIRAENVGSIKAFAGAGYTEQGEPVKDGEFRILRRRREANI